MRVDFYYFSNISVANVDESHVFLLEQSDEARLLIRQKIGEATERNKNTWEEIEHNFKLKDILLPCNAALEVCCMAPSDGDEAEALVIDFERMANAQSEREWVRELRQKVDRDRIDVGLPDSENKYVHN